MAPFYFDIQSALPVAWDMLWAERLKRRKEDDDYYKKYGKRPHRSSAGYYICANDMENAIRSFAAQSCVGKPWSLDYCYYGHPIRFRGNLKGTVRDWLLRGNGGKIVGHNFGRGHISGMRFRPAGERMAEAELETMVRKEARRNKPSPRHYTEPQSSTLLCMKGRKRTGFGWGRRNHRIWTTSTKEDVTCPRCINRLSKLGE